MKLYYKQGACSLSQHINLLEAGLPFELVKVDLAQKKLPDGSDYLKVTKKGQVPALELDDGSVLTENPVIAEYIGDQAPDSSVMPRAGSKERYEVAGWMSYVGTEIHKTMSPLFRPDVPEDYKPFAKELLARKLKFVDEALAGRQYLTGDRFTAADAYLFVIVTWLPGMGIDVGQWPNLKRFGEEARARPMVQEALRGEGNG